MCALRAHIKLSIFGNIFLEIEKAVNTFSILEKFFSKNENYYVSLGHTLANLFLEKYFFGGRSSLIGAM